MQIKLIFFLAITFFSTTLLLFSSLPKLMRILEKLSFCQESRKYFDPLWVGEWSEVLKRRRAKVKQICEEYYQKGKKEENTIFKYFMIIFIPTVF